MKAKYNVKNNPKYINGEMNESQCLQQFLDSFDIKPHKDGIVKIIYLVYFNLGLENGINLNKYEGDL